MARARVSARLAGVLGIALAVAVAVLALARWRVARTPLASESTRAVRITQRDAVGLPARQAIVRDAAHVRALVAALGIDAHPAASCPDDYAEAPVGLVLSGTDVYARRNVYVYGLSATDAADASAGDADARDARPPPTVVTVTSQGCRAGPPADVLALERELRSAPPFVRPVP